MLVIFLGLQAFAAGQNNIPKCGKLGQRCCRLADYEVDDRLMYGKILKQKKTNKFRYCVGDYYDDLACDIETDKCIDEATLDCGREGERCCNLKNDVAGDYPSMLVCLDYNQILGYYAELDLYCDFTDNTCKQFVDLPCGVPGKACCSQATFDSSEDYEWLGKYQVYDKSCSESWCTKGVCEACNKDGDKCCDTGSAGPSTEPFCMDMLCVDGTCKECGEEGQLCCDHDRKNTWPSYYFEDSTALCNDKNQVCSDGRCVGKEGSCYGYTCEWNEECDDYLKECILCGQINNGCCSDGSCSEDFLTCLGGKCQCGELGQKCCEGLYSSSYCYNSKECRDGLCFDFEQETSCGQKGEQCCDGGLCVDSTICNEKKNKCRACGKNNQKCCPGGTCANARLACNSDDRCVKD